MKSNRTSAFVALFLACSISQAAPVRHGSFKATQPDGHVLEMTVTGDEFGHLTTTLDGVAVERDADGVWRYAVSATYGRALPGTVMAHSGRDRTRAEKRELAGIDQQAIRNAVLVNGHQASMLTKAGSGEYSTTDFPTKGKCKVLVVLVDFPDKQFTLDSVSLYNRYNRMYNETGYRDTLLLGSTKQTGAIGSVKDYFRAQSFNAFEPEFILLGPVRADYGYAHYGSNSGGDSRNAQQLTLEICNKIRSRKLADLSQFDANGDKYIDMMAIVYAGQGENYQGSDPNTIWPHNSSTSLKSHSDGIIGANYFMTCELFMNSTTQLDGIGVFCHEFSHTLGLPDFYYLSGSDNDTNAAMGYWSIMDYGVYENYGFAPVGYTAFERFSVGWDSIITLKENGTYALKNIENGRERAVILESETSNRFFVLENRQTTGWYSFQKSHGLMVTAIQYNLIYWRDNKVNSTSSKRHLYIIPADNNRCRYTGNGHTDTTYGDLFPYQGLDSLTANSTPALQVNGKSPKLGIYDIVEKDSIVSFTLGTGSTSAVVSPEADDTALQVYNLAGQLQPFSANGLPKGVWIVRQNGRTRKVTVQ